MKNFIAKGEIIQHTAAADISSGDVVAIGTGGLLGVAIQDIANTKTGSVFVDDGVFLISTKGHDGSANAAVAVGDKLYWVSGNSGFVLNKKSTDTFFGYALEAVTSGSTATIKVRKSSQIA